MGKKGTVGPPGQKKKGVRGAAARKIIRHEGKEKRVFAEKRKVSASVLIAERGGGGLSAYPPKKKNPRGEAKNIIVERQKEKTVNDLEGKKQQPNVREKGKNSRNRTEARQNLGLCHDDVRTKK